MKRISTILLALTLSLSALAQDQSVECTRWLQRCEFLNTDNCVRIKINQDEFDRLNKSCLPPYIKRLQAALNESRNIGSVSAAVNQLLVTD